MKKALFIIGISIVILSLVAACAGPTPEPPQYWPTEGWRTSTPEEQGMDSERLAAALDLLQLLKG